jgi:hypothetical protein
MPTPFPGMDPYLEEPGLWEEVHTNLIVGIQHFINPLVRPHYRVAVERYTYLSLFPVDDSLPVGKPDVLVLSPIQTESQVMPATTAKTVTATAEPVVAEIPMPEEIRPRYLEIRDTKTNEVVTVIEVLSPVNKVNIQGRKKYLNKRFKIVESMSHLVEIDLLRAGQPLPMRISGQNDYRILVSRSQRRPQADVYMFSVQEAVPDIPIPLHEGESEPVLCLNQILHTLYDEAGYDLAVDYRQPLVPPLSDEAAEWVKKQLIQAGRITGKDNE